MKICIIRFFVFEILLSYVLNIQKILDYCFLFFLVILVEELIEQLDIFLFYRRIERFVLCITSLGGINTKLHKHELFDVEGMSCDKFMNALSVFDKIKAEFAFD